MFRSRAITVHRLCIAPTFQVHLLYLFLDLRVFNDHEPPMLVISTTRGTNCRVKNLVDHLVGYWVRLQMTHTARRKHHLKESGFCHRSFSFHCRDSLLVGESRGS